MRPKEPATQKAGVAGFFAFKLGGSKQLEKARTLFALSAKCTPDRKRSTRALLKATLVPDSLAKVELGISVRLIPRWRLRSTAARLIIMHSSRYRSSSGWLVLFGWG